MQKLSVNEFLDKILRKISNKASRKIELLKDSLFSSYSKELNEYKLDNILSKPVKYEFDKKELIEIKELTSLYIKHYFDLLGSGWVNVKYNMDCQGLEGYKYTSKEIEVDKDNKWIDTLINKKNLSYSKYVRSKISDNYSPIDWRIDFKSGYCWDSKKHYSEMVFGKHPGVDVKVPWELSRMQHLVQFVWAYTLAKEGKEGFYSPEVYVREFQDEVLDFISTNPPSFGVNWACTMDVSIRAANWLFVYDLFKVQGATFDKEFEKILTLSIYDHGKFIFKHLERDKEIRNNHYLSNIVGLFFIAAYLPITKEISNWLCFSFQELIQEMAFQFYEEGSNFEHSTAYHRLSGELILYATALALALPIEKEKLLQDYDLQAHIRICKKQGFKPDSSKFWNMKNNQLFPDWYIDRLEKVAKFIVDITKPNGEIAQFGDNDSGRFFKIQSLYNLLTVKEAKRIYLNLKHYDSLNSEENYWDEKFLDHRFLVAGINALFKRTDFFNFVNIPSVEYELIRNMVEEKVKKDKIDSLEFKAHNNFEVLTNEQDKKAIQQLKNQNQFMEYTFHSESNLLYNINTIAYPKFGLYIFKSANFYLAIRCGALGSKGKGSHDHNDQLSIELMIDGKDIIKDPGTYLYTPIPEKRNLFRSTKSHFTVQSDSREQNYFSDGLKGLFSMQNKTHSECLEFKYNSFIGCHSGYGKKVYRQIKIYENKVIITDFGSDIPYQEFNYYSNGYGRIMKIK